MVGINTVYRHISSLSSVKTITTFTGRFGGIKMFPTEEEKKIILTESEIERMIELLRTSKLREDVNIIGKNTKAIKEYIATQIEKDKQGDQLSMFDPRDPFTGSK